MNQNTSQEPLFTTGVAVEITISNAAILKLIAGFAVCVALYFIGLKLYKKYA